MLVVTDLNGKSELLLDYRDGVIIEQVNGDFSLSLSVPNSVMNKELSYLLQEESILETEDGHEFRIKNLNSDRMRANIQAQHIFFDLIDNFVYDMTGGTKSLDEFLSFALTGSGWTFEVKESFHSMNVFNFGENNSLSLLKELMYEFGAEYLILPGKHIEIYHELGKDDDFQFRFKHNTKSLKKMVDTSKLSTMIKGFGADGLQVEYQSPNVSIYGIRHAEPIRDDRYTVPDSLIERCKQAIKDVPDVSIEVEAVQLNGELELGEKVWLIYEPMGIEFQTRVMERKRLVRHRQPKSSTITLANIKPTTANQFTKMKSEITTVDKGVRETKSRIDQTNERLTLEVERVDESIATLQIEADNITLSVQSLEGRMGSAEAQISVQAGQISSKVSQTDFNGNTIASLINQTSTTIDIQASKINLIGAVSVLSEITGDLGTINAGNITGVNITGGTMIGTKWTSSGTGTPFDVAVGGFDSMKVYHGSLRLIQNGSEYCVINNSGVFINGQQVGAGTAKWG